MAHWLSQSSRRLPKIDNTEIENGLPLCRKNYAQGDRFLEHHERECAMDLLEMRGIVNDFPGIRAVDRVDLSIAEGEIHALLGENGAGKTTLMNILYGLYRPEAGSISWCGKPVHINKPNEAISLGIGMVHQHFMLVKKMTALENILLGMHMDGYPFIHREMQEQQVSRICEKYGLHIDMQKRVDQLSVGEQQRVEILKALFRNARLLILDEPTSVLTPQETKEFFHILRMLRKEGHSIILIAHNLSEILSIADRITVLRDGKKVCTLDAASTNERELSRCMIGRDFLEQGYIRTETKKDQDILQLCGLTLQNGVQLPLLDNINLTVHSGEILGVAGIDGNGQGELVEVITGIRRQSKGTILFHGESIQHLSIRKRWEKGIAYVPSDRHQDGLIMDADITANTALRTYYCTPYAKGPLLRSGEIQNNAKSLVDAYQVKIPALTAKVRVLSGGNQQKLILSRELQAEGDLIIACQPTRGLDIGATEYLRQQLLERRNQGKSVLLVSTDLGEILALSDRIAVIHSGKIMGIVSNVPGLSTELLGLMMVGMPLEEAQTCL